MEKIRELYLLRHAEAVELGTQNVTRDQDRMLTPKGVRQAYAMGAVLRQAEVLPLAVWSSPYQRAQETAARVMETLAVAPERLITVAELAPQGSPDAIWRKLRRVDDPRILLVGHLPSIAILTGWLLGTPHTALRFRKAALARVDISMNSGLTPPAAELSWFVPAFLAQALD